jgi:hypothetical protein
MLMGPSDDILVAGENSEVMGRWGLRFPDFQALRARAARIPARFRFRGESEPVEYYGSWLSDAFNKVKTAVSGGTLSVGPGGISLMKPTPAPTPSSTPGGAVGGIMSYVQRNPLPIAAGAAVILFLVLKKKKR